MRQLVAGLEGLGALRAAGAAVIVGRLGRAGRVGRLVGIGRYLLVIGVRQHGTGDLARILHVAAGIIAGRGLSGVLRAAGIVVRRIGGEAVRHSRQHRVAGDILVTVAAIDARGIAGGSAGGRHGGRRLRVGVVRVVNVKRFALCFGTAGAGVACAALRHTGGRRAARLLPVVRFRRERTGDDGVSRDVGVAGPAVKVIMDVVGRRLGQGGRRGGVFLIGHQLRVADLVAAVVIELDFIVMLGPGRRVAAVAGAAGGNGHRRGGAGKARAGPAREVIARLGGIVQRDVGAFNRVAGRVGRSDGAVVQGVTDRVGLRRITQNPAERVGRHVVLGQRGRLRVGVIVTGVAVRRHGHVVAVVIVLGFNLELRTVDALVGHGRRAGVLHQRVLGVGQRSGRGGDIRRRCRRVAEHAIGVRQRVAVGAPGAVCVILFNIGADTGVDKGTQGTLVNGGNLQDDQNVRHRPRFAYCAAGTASEIAVGRCVRTRNGVVDWFRILFTDRGVAVVAAG